MKKYDKHHYTSFDLSELKDGTYRDEIWGNPKEVYALMIMGNRSDTGALGQVARVFVEEDKEGDTFYFRAMQVDFDRTKREHEEIGRKFLRRNAIDLAKQRMLETIEEMGGFIGGMDRIFGK